MSAIVAVRRPAKRRRTFVSGRDRVGGFYGRFSGQRAELKFHDVALDVNPISSVGGVTATINIIAQGVTESQRVGRKCTIRSIHWKYQLDLPEIDAAATPAAGESFRVILFLDKQCNGATAAVLDILEIAELQGFRNLANQGRFTILMDKIHNVNYQTMASDGAGVVSMAETINNYTMYKRCNIPIEFSGTTGAIGEIRSNNLGVLLVGVKNTGQFFSSFRLRFSDA